MMEVKLPDVCQIQYGFAFDSAQFSTATGIPLIRIRDVVRGYSETCTTEQCSEEYFVNDGDLLIGMDGEFNIARWQGGRALLNQRVCRLLPNGKIDSGYLFYFMPQALKKIEDQTPFVTVKHLSAKQLNAIRILLPELDEQRRIAAVLDKISALISLRKRQLDKLDELVKARFVEMFGDPISNSANLPTKQLGKLCILKAGATTAADAIHEFNSEYQIPCYGGNGIRGYVKESTQHGMYPIIGRQGALCGNVQFASGDFHATEHAVLVTPIIEMDVIWLFYLLKYMDLYRFHTGAAQPGLAVKTLNTVITPLAKIELQRSFSSFSKQIDRQKLTIQQSLDKLEVLKKALMQEYF